MIVFAVPEEYYVLLRKASYMSDFSVELFPVPHGVAVATAEGETTVSSQTLKDFINANTVPNDEITAQTETEEAAADTTDTTSKSSKSSKER